MWEYYTKYVTSIYRFDRGSNNSELVFDTTNRKVSKTIDQGLEENDEVQSTTNLQPLLCTKSEKVGNRYFLKFDGTQRMVSNINLNVVSGAKDIVNVFIVYRIKAFDVNTYWTRNGSFGHDKFVCFGPFGDLVVSGSTNNYIAIGGNSVNNKKPKAPYKYKANAGQTKKWVCLPIHWDNHTTSFGNHSSVYCNGQKIANFQRRTSIGSTQMTFGDLNPRGIAPFKGDISFLAVYKDKIIDENDILLHHSILCN